MISQSQTNIETTTNPDSISINYDPINEQEWFLDLWPYFLASHFFEGVAYYSLFVLFSRLVGNTSSTKLGLIALPTCFIILDVSSVLFTDLQSVQDLITVFCHGSLLVATFNVCDSQNR